MGATVFSSIAGLITVKDLLDPFGPPLEHDCTVENAYATVVDAAVDGEYSELERASLVYEADEVVGAVWVEEFGLAHEQIKDCMEEMRVTTLLSSHTTAFEAARLLCRGRRPYYYVLDRTEPVGTLTYSGLFKLPFRLCLFALTLELEQTALRLLMQDAAASWHTLSDGRKEKARSVFQRRHGKPPNLEQEPFRDLLDCTYFSDKGRMLKKRGLIPPAWRSAIELHFDLGEDLRNMCAHPAADDGAVGRIPDRKTLGDFVERTDALFVGLGSDFAT